MINIQGKLTLEEDIAFKQMILTDLNTLINKYTADIVGKLMLEKAEAIIDKDDLLHAISWFYYSEINPKDTPEEIKEAKQNLFRVAGLIE